jgi:hypothetical protein
LSTNILLSTLFLDILNLFYILSMRDHVPHPYKTTDRYFPPIVDRRE